MMPEEITLQLRQLWRLGDNYGQVLNVPSEGIHAEVSYAKERVGKSYQDIIRARINGFNVPSLSKDGFSSILEGQAWCEKWYLYMSENARLKQEVERYKANYRSVCDELSKLRAELNEARWDEVREKYGWNVPKEGSAMNQTLKAITQLASEMGGSVDIRRDDFTVYIDDDQATFNRTPEEMQHALEILQEQQQGEEYGQK